MGPPPCLLCGKKTGAFVGLCDSCCRMIKAKTDAFARKSQHELAEARKLADDLKQIEASKDKSSPAAKKHDDDLVNWPIKDMPL